jgi:acetyl esterase/lipase
MTNLLPLLNRPLRGALVLLVGLALSQPAPLRACAPPRSAGVRQTLDIRYFPGGDRRHLLDVFAPRGAERAPVVLFVHGGTWMYGDKNFFGRYRNVGRFLARHGIVAVLPNYRLSPAVKHPEHARDVARAFAWVSKNVARYGGDPGRIVLCGHSAGGHLVALLATDESYLKDPALKLTPQQRGAVHGVIGICGVYRIPGPEEFRTMAGHIVNHWLSSGMGGQLSWLAPVLKRAGEEVNPFRLVFGDDRDVQRRASPLEHVHKGLPPFLLLHAAWEVPGLADMAEDFAAALQRVGTAAEVRDMPHTTHRTILFRVNEPGDPVGQALLTFIARCTGK